MKKLQVLFSVLLVTILLFSCSNDDPQPSGSGDFNVVIVDYDITEPAIWHSDSVYIVPVNVKINASLVIQPGTLVKFKSEAGIEVWENGTIIAIGEKDSLIVFTSFKDDLGGDHNKDGFSSIPGIGDWDYISLGDQNGSEFSHCVFKYGGGQLNSGVLDLGTNYSKIQHCTFAFNKTWVSGDVFYGALAAQDAANTTIITDNLFYGNTVPLSINGHCSINNSNSFSIITQDEEEISNTYNGIFVHGQDIIEHNTSWEETEVAFVIQYDNFEIWENFSLTLGNNVTLKFFTGAMLNLQNPSVLINGQGSNVFFTSFKDDSKKGDTNNDGGTTNPPSEDEWLGIYNGSDFHTWSNILYSKNDF
jgi:hypothetical protein